MEVLKLIVLLSSVYYSCASHDHHKHTIPVEGYDTGLQDLGQHVEVPETPVKIIKITKTVAIKVPVPYPVKVIQKVPYPVHVNKPYPVHVPQIVHVPAPTHKDNAESNQHGYADGPSYEAGQQDLYGGGHFGQKNTEAVAEEHPAEGYSYEAPSHGYYGKNGNHDESNSFESQSYDQAIKNYLQKISPNTESYGSYADSGFHH